MTNTDTRYWRDELAIFAELADSVIPGAPISSIDLSPIALMKRAGYTPDDWQEELMTSEADTTLCVATRQAGKTQSSAILLGSNAAISEETNWIVASPSFAQSARILARLRNMWRRIILSYDGADIMPPRIMNRDKSLILFENRSTITALPDNPVTIRGETAHGVLYEEAAYVGSDIREVVDFMLGATGGKTWEITSAGIIGTPMHGKWEDLEAPDTLRIEVPWWRVPRISRAFVEKQRREKTAQTFAREMECKWSAREGAMFNEADIIAAADNNSLLASDMIPGLEELFAA